MRASKRGLVRRTQGPASFEELLEQVRDLPQGFRGSIHAGAMHVAPPPTAARAHALAEIQAALVAGSAAGEPVPAGWSFAPGVEIGGAPQSLLVADLAGWMLPRQAICSTSVDVAPHWVCEVPGGAARAFVRTAKRSAWAELGVRVLWMVDVEAHVLEVFQSTGGKWALVGAYAEDEQVMVPPFEGLHFDVGDLWLPEMPATPAPPSSRRRAP